MKLIAQMMKWSRAAANYFQALILKSILYLREERGTESVKTKYYENAMRKSVSLYAN